MSNSVAKRQSDVFFKRFSCVLCDKSFGTKAFLNGQLDTDRLKSVVEDGVDCTANHLHITTRPKTAMCFTVVSRARATKSELLIYQQR